MVAGRWGQVGRADGEVGLPGPADGGADATGVSLGGVDLNTEIEIGSVLVVGVREFVRPHGEWWIDSDSAWVCQFEPVSTKASAMARARISPVSSRPNFYQSRTTIFL